jgi:hypothetical protein
MFLKIFINEMGKTVTLPSWIDSNTYKSATSIPAQSSMSVSGQNIDCTNINLPAVKTLLNEDSFQLSDLCTSPNINKWSRYRPGSWYSNNTGGSNWLPDYGSAPVFVPQYPTSNYTLSSFAGYQHTATTDQKPTYFTPQTNVVDGNMEIGSGGQNVYYQCRLARGHRIPVCEEKNVVSNALEKVRVYWYLNNSLQKIDPPQHQTPFTVPAGGYVESEYSGTIYSSYQVRAVPYYTDVEGDIQYSMIEDGFKTANVTCFSLSSLFSGNLSNLYFDGMYLVYNASVSRTTGGYTTSLFVRLRIEGDLITPTNPIELWWSGQWGQPETKDLFNQYAVADRMASGSITVYLEANTSAGSAGWWELDSTTLTW